MSKQIKAGADIHAGDGGYSIGTKEEYDASAKIRNQSFGRLRIKELAAEAGFVFWDGEDWAPPGSEIDWACDYSNEFNQFVRLIVEECARIADDPLPYVGCGYITKTKGMLIKEYFGVDYEL